MKYKLISILSSVTLIVFSQNCISLPTNNPTKQEKLITNTLIYLNKVWSNKGKSPRAITMKYFDPEVTLTINGKTVFTGYDQFDAHFQEVGKHIFGKVLFPLLEVIPAGDKLIVRFDEDIHTQNGTHYPTNVMAIFTIHNGRIKRWEEVVFTRYFFQAEASNVVYSK